MKGGADVELQPTSSDSSAQQSQNGAMSSVPTAGNKPRRIFVVFGTALLLSLVLVSGLIVGLKRPGNDGSQTDANAAEADTNRDSDQEATDEPIETIGNEDDTPSAPATIPSATATTSATTATTPTMKTSATTTTATTITTERNISPAPTARLPSLSPTIEPGVTYRPGMLTVSELGLLLSEGLTVRKIAETGSPVQYSDGSMSPINFHDQPDAAATYEDPNNPGGWIYVSNSENLRAGQGGVGAITFDRDGNILKYQMVLEGSIHNCGGGRTPWETWVSCEEHFANGSGAGKIYQVDPTGQRPAEVTTVGAGLGRFESFTFDARNRDQPRFFASEDRRRGAVRRFTPTNPNWEEPWEMLHGDGKLDYLILMPSFDGATTGTIRWTDSLDEAKGNAAQNYPECEGIDVNGNAMYLISKRWKTMWIFDLDAMTYERYSTEYGAFDGRPDQVQRILADDDDEDTILYFTEEGGENAGIHGRNKLGQFFTLMEGPGMPDETTGLAFSPDGMHMLVAFQDNGYLFDITRTDGFPFHFKTLDVKHHNAAR